MLIAARIALKMVNLSSENLPLEHKEQVTIRLSSDLIKRLDEYLKKNPSDSLEAMLNEALRVRTPQDISPLLKMAGIVEQDTYSIAEKSSDSYHPQD